MITITTSFSSDYHLTCGRLLLHSERFNVETAKAMDVASDPRIGLMCLLWWQETVDKIYSNKLIRHPTAQALSSVVSENKISKAWLKCSFEARINDARREVTDILESIEEYVHGVASLIICIISVCPPGESLGLNLFDACIVYLGALVSKNLPSRRDPMECRQH